MADKESQMQKEKYIMKSNSKSPAELRKMNPQEKARYLAYKEPSKEIRSAIVCSQQRLQQWSKENKNTLKTTIPQRDEEYRKHENLIGQLKAAEARNRIRLMRLKYQSFRVEEVNHFISCQPTAQRALRLELLLPRKIDTSSPGDTLDTLERKRIEEILEDERGLTIKRT
ncbi:protein LKAAEAR1-like [Erpetoichthys calabaricus]|uniref:LKAAEAR motif containing 1 n=1 Tax=Erpetoichthys calabaricus TaxID=27687 RepID=A0A8C4S420_ERPCA|nr:protein LKAAEAR1-like [Erpetoichthys calabaricus]